MNRRNSKASRQEFKTRQDKVKAKEAELAGKKKRKRDHSALCQDREGNAAENDL